MTPRPGRLARIFDIELPRPRTIEMTFEPEFIELIQEIKAMVETGGGADSGGRVSEVPTELRDEIPTFEEGPPADHGPIDWTGLTSVRGAKSALEIGTIIAIAVGVFFGLEGILRWTNTPEYVFPKPTAVVETLVDDFSWHYAHHLWVTVQEFLIGFAIGSTIGLVLAAVITQKPFAEKVGRALHDHPGHDADAGARPFLRVSLIQASRHGPIIVAVALASGPMVLINAATGFRRTDLAKIALARSYGASTLPDLPQDPLPAGAADDHRRLHGRRDLRAADRGRRGDGLGERGGRARPPAHLLLVADPDGRLRRRAPDHRGTWISIYVVFYFVGKRWASWES